MTKIEITVKYEKFIEKMRMATERYASLPIGSLGTLTVEVMRSELELAASWLPYVQQHGRIADTNIIYACDVIKRANACSARNI